MGAAELEQVRSVYERWARGELWTPEVFHPDVEVIWDPLLLDVGDSRGIEAFTSQVRRFLSAWDEVRFTADRLVDHGDRVLAEITVTGRGRGSEIETSMSTAHVWTFRHGRAIRLEGFTDLDAARRAAAGD